MGKSIVKLAGIHVVLSKGTAVDLKLKHKITYHRHSQTQPSQSQLWPGSPPVRSSSWSKTWWEREDRATTSTRAACSDASARASVVASSRIARRSYSWNYVWMSERTERLIPFSSYSWWVHSCFGTFLCGGFPFLVYSCIFLYFPNCLLILIIVFYVN